jgi:hypothetical protein
VYFVHTVTRSCRCLYCVFVRRFSLHHQTRWASDTLSCLLGLLREAGSRVLRAPGLMGRYSPALLPVRGGHNFRPRSLIASLTLAVLAESHGPIQLNIETFADDQLIYALQVDTVQIRNIRYKRRTHQSSCASLCCHQISDLFFLCVSLTAPARRVYLCSHSQRMTWRVLRTSRAGVPLSVAPPGHQSLSLCCRDGALRSPVQPLSTRTMASTAPDAGAAIID